MYAITGITGKVGGEVARALLSAKRPVRAVLRDAGKGDAWRDRGCSVAIADLLDVAALTAAFSGAEGVFVLLPPSFDPSPGFPEARAIIAAVRSALVSAHPPKVVCLSTIGAQATQPSLLSQLGVVETVLGDLPMPVTFLRPAWFMENSSWDVAAARDASVIPSFLQPLDKRFPMVATADIGHLGAELLQETWSGRRVVELRVRTVSPRTTSRPPSPRFWDIRSGPKPLPEETGKLCSSRRECIIRRRECKCSTASTKGGSNSSEVKQDREKDTCR